VARRTWPQQQATDECLKLVDCFHSVAGKFDTALSRSAMKIQLARTPKGDAALSMMSPASGAVAGGASNPALPVPAR
jgi:hypothetical protein